MSDEQPREQTNGIEQSSQQEQIKENDRKLFVSGSSWDTTEKELNENVV